MSQQLVNQYLVGPILLAKYVKNDVTVILVGDEHDSLDYKCSNDASEQTKTNIQDYIPSLVESLSPKFVDIFLELVYRSKTKELILDEKFYLDSYMIETAKKFQDCIYNKSKCKYTNVRVHYTDFRVLREHSHGLDSFIQNITRAVHNAILKVSTPEEEKLTISLAKPLLFYKDKYETRFRDMMNPLDAVTYFMYAMTKIEKFGLKNDGNFDNIVRQSLMRIFNDDDRGMDHLRAYCDALIDKINIFLKDKTSRKDETFLKEFDLTNIFIHNLWKSMNGVLIDVYVFSRLFKKFKHKANNNMPTDIKNAIVFLGANHCENIGIMLQQSGFTRVFSEISEDPETSLRCVKNNSTWFG